MSETICDAVASRLAVTRFWKLSEMMGQMLAVASRPAVFWVTRFCVQILQNTLFYQKLVQQIVRDDRTDVGRIPPPPPPHPSRPQKWKVVRTSDLTGPRIPHSPKWKVVELDGDFQSEESHITPPPGGGGRRGGHQLDITKHAALRKMSVSVKTLTRFTSKILLALMWWTSEPLLANNNTSDVNLTSVNISEANLRTNLSSFVIYLHLTTCLITVTYSKKHLWDSPLRCCFLSLTL